MNLTQHLQQFLIKYQKSKNFSLKKYFPYRCCDGRREEGSGREGGSKGGGPTKRCRGHHVPFRAAAAQIVLPATTLALFALAPIARITRASMLAVLGSEFIRTARASGLSGPTVVITYALRNALLPVVTVLGMVFSFLLGANVLVEKVFAWPGIGSYAVEALIASDFAPVQGFVLTMAVLYVLLNLGIDLLNRAIDPRARHGA
jgi:peptide/nickel transport system permease protein